MTYWSEVEVLAGLKLEGDTTPLSSTLSDEPDLIDGNLHKQCTSNDWLATYGYGIDLGSPQSVGMLRVHMDPGTAPASWRGSYNGDLSAYYSNDNATWTLILTKHCSDANFPLRSYRFSRFASFDFEFGSTITSRYFKIVNTGSYVTRFSSPDGDFYSGNSPGSIKAYISASGSDPNITVGSSTSVSLDPNHKSNNITLSNDNLTATADDESYKSVRGNVGIASGKIYFEVTIDAISSLDFSSAIGFGTADALISGRFFNAAGGWGCNGLGSMYAEGSLYSFTQATGFRYSSAGQNTIGIAFDADNGKAWFIADDQWGGLDYVGDPAADANPNLVGIRTPAFPMLCLYKSGTQMTMNFGASDFKYQVPSGFGVIQEPIIESVVITEPPNVRELINRIAYEASSLEYWDAGAHNLVYLPTHTTVSKIIDGNRIDKESVSVGYTDRVDLLNSLSLWHDYYWADYTGDDAFRKSVEDSDDDSIGDYGTLKGSPLEFKYLLGTQNSGRAIRWLLTQLKNPRLTVKFTGGFYLTNIRRGNLISFDFESGDALDNAFSGFVTTSQKFIVLNVTRSITSITLKVVLLKEI